MDLKKAAQQLMVYWIYIQ